MARRLLLVPTLVSAALALAACSGSSASESDAESPASGPASASPGASASSPEMPEGLVTLEVPPGPVGLAAARNGVWVASGLDDSVSLLRHGDVVDTVRVPEVPLRATVVGGDLYVTTFHGQQLVRVRDGKARLLADLQPGPEGVVHGWDRLWVVEQDNGTLAEVAPASGHVEKRTRIGQGARLVASGPDGVYVAHTESGRVLTVDPDTGEVVARARVPRWPQGLAVSQGRVWVACTFGQEVVSLDASTLEQLTSTPVTGAPDPVEVTDDGRVLVVAQVGPRLVELDPDSGEVLAEVTLGTESDLRDLGNLDIAVHDGAAYVSSYRGDVVHVLPLSSL